MITIQATDQEFEIKENDLLSIPYFKSFNEFNECNKSIVEFSIPIPKSTFDVILGFAKWNQHKKLYTDGGPNPRFNREDAIADYDSLIHFSDHFQVDLCNLRAQSEFSHGKMGIID